MSLKREHDEDTPEKYDNVIKQLKEIVYSIDHIGEPNPVTSCDITSLSDNIYNTHQETRTSLDLIGENLHKLNDTLDGIKDQLERIADKYCKK